MKIVARKGEDLESLIRRWKRSVNESGVLRELKMHRYFMTRKERKLEKAKRNRKRRK